MTMMSKPQIIFVGGTGRCGKSVVAECLAQHPDAFKLPFELRFLTDPDGIIDFYTSSQASWSPFLMDKRIKRLGQLLKRLAYSAGDKYANWRLRRHLPRWNEHMEGLMHSLYDFSYAGTWFGVENARMYHAGPTNKEDLACVLGAFVETVIKDLLETNDKSIFISDDTWSVLFAKELSELLPQAKFIHVYRDPRDVVNSMSKQRWCPSDLAQAARYYISLMESIDETLISLCFEGLVDFPRMNLEDKCYQAGIEYDSAMLKPLDSAKTNIGRWRDEPEQEWVELVMPLVKRLEYE